MLKSMTQETKILFAVSELKRTNEISAEEATLIRKQVSSNDPSLSFLYALVKKTTVINDLNNLVKTYLSQICQKPDPNEDFSPAAQKTISMAAEDSSPIGKALALRKRLQETKYESSGDFGINLLQNADSP